MILGSSFLKEIEHGKSSENQFPEPRHGGLEALGTKTHDSIGKLSRTLNYCLAEALFRPHAPSPKGS